MSTAGYYNVYQQLTSVRLATESPITGIYDNGTIQNGVAAALFGDELGVLSIDGFEVNDNDRVLLTHQDDPNQNGVYVVSFRGSDRQVWELIRAPDFQSIEQLKAGLYIPVSSGNTFAGAMYLLIEPLPSSIGNSRITFINTADASGGTGGPYLLKSQNLSDTDNLETAFANLGLGSGQILILNDSDFSGGIYTLTNPCPNYITALCNTPGNKIRLPSALGLASFALSEGPYIQIPRGFQSVRIDTNSGVIINTLDPPDMTNFTVSSKATSDGEWLQIGRVTGIVSDGPGSVLSGLVDFTSNDSSISINSTGGTIDLSASATGIKQQLFVNSADGNDALDGLTFGTALKTYAQAVTIAITKATIDNQYIINLIGDFNETLTLYPFLHLNGQNSGTFTSPGNITSDSSFDIIANSFCNVSNMSLDSTRPMIIIFGASQNQRIALYNTTLGNIPNIAFEGFSGSELLYILNSPIAGSALASGLSVTRGIVALDNVIVVGTCDVSCDGTIDSTLSIKNSGMGGTIYIDSTSSTGGVPSLQLYNTFNAGYQLSGTLSLLSIDPFSYTSQPIYFGGSTIAQVSITSLADSILQSSYSPSNFTPSNAGGNYNSSSLTSMIHGIDNAIGAIGPTQTLQNAYDNGASTVKGTIQLTADGLNSLVTYAPQFSATQIHTALLNAVNPNDHFQPAWRQSFIACSAPSTNFTTYAAVEAAVLDNTDSTESGGLRLYATSGGTETVGLLVDGLNQKITSPWDIVSNNLPSGFAYSVSTYVPKIGDGINWFSASSETASWTKLGHMNMIQGWIVWTSKGSATAGTPIKLLLPSPIGATNPRITGTIGFLTGLNYSVPLALTGSTAFDYCSIWRTDGSGGMNGFVVSDFATSGEIQFTIFYIDN